MCQALLSTPLMAYNLLIGKATQNAVFCNSVSEAPMFQNNDAFSVDGTAFDGSCAGQVGVSGNISVQPQFVNTLRNNHRRWPVAEEST